MKSRICRDLTILVLGVAVGACGVLVGWRPAGESKLNPIANPAPKDVPGPQDSTASTISSGESSDKTDPQPVGQVASTHLKTAVKLADQGQLDGALRHFQEALRLSPDEATVHGNLGMALIRFGLWQAATGYLREALRLDPDQSQTANNLAWILATHPDPKVRNGAEAVRLAEQICKEDSPNRPHEWLDTLSVAYAETGRFAEALQAAQQALAGASAAGDEAKVGEIQDRIALYQARQPFRMPTPSATRGAQKQEYLLSDAQIEQSLRQYFTTLGSRPDKWDVANQAAWVWATHPDQRVRDVKLALELSTTLCDLTKYAKADYLDTLAAALAQGGRFEEAVKVARRGLSLGAETTAGGMANRLYLYELGVAYQDDAGPAFLPDGGGPHHRRQWRMAYFHYILARRCQRLGLTNAAVFAYRQALLFDPSYTRAHVELAVLLRSNGDKQTALTHLQAAALAKPDDYHGQHRLAIVLAEDGKTDEALRHFQEAQRLGAPAEEVANNIAAMLLRAGKVDEAVQYCRETLGEHPDLISVANNLAWVLATHEDARIRNGAEAVRLAEHTCELSKHNDPELLDTLAAAYAESGRFEDAMRTVQIAVDLLQKTGAKEEAARMQLRLAQYESRQPTRDQGPPAGKPSPNP